MVIIRVDKEYIDYSERKGYMVYFSDGYRVFLLKHNDGTVYNKKLFGSGLPEKGTYQPYTEKHIQYILDKLNISKKIFFLHEINSENINLLIGRKLKLERILKC